MNHYTRTKAVVYCTERKCEYVSRICGNIHFIFWSREVHSLSRCNLIDDICDRFLVYLFSSQADSVSERCCCIRKLETGCLLPKTGFWTNIIIQIYRKEDAHFDGLRECCLHRFALDGEYITIEQRVKANATFSLIRSLSLQNCGGFCHSFDKQLLNRVNLPINISWLIRIILCGDRGRSNYANQQN